ncbi:MAG TPA: hypothetical protein VI953_04530 [Candidatus Paceibacterota bacterium]
MAEGANIEAEIAALSQQIEAKRAQLESERGSHVETGEALHHVVSDLTGHVPATPLPQAKKLTSQPAKSYLDDLDPADAEKVNALIDLIPKLGLFKTIARAKEQPAYILDAFHDALVDKLRDELKRQKLI